jgi:hypothetical protein
MFITCFTETVAVQYSIFAYGGKNDFVYNMYLMFTIPIMLYLFYKMLGLQGIAIKIYAGICLLCFAFVGIDFLYIEKPFNFNIYTLILIQVIYIVLSCLVLLELGKDDKHINLFEHPFFWINAGNLLFSLGALVMLGLLQFVRDNNIKAFNEGIQEVVMRALNIILYCAYSVGFILCQRQMNKLL